MTWKALRTAPLAKLVLAMAVGALVGACAPACVIRALNSFGGTFAQFVKFIVPLIIVGLVTPAIAEAGRRAGRLLLATIALAYASTILAGAFGFYLADAVLPHLVSGSLAATWLVLLMQYCLAGAIALIADRFYRKSGRQAGRAA